MIEDNYVYMALHFFHCLYIFCTKTATATTTTTKFYREIRKVDRHNAILEISKIVHVYVFTKKKKLSAAAANPPF